MPKNIVVFSDGTGQDGGLRPEQVLSNIYKLYRACRIGPASSINPAEQVTFYDPGLGTDTTATGWSRVTRSLQKLLSSVTGRGITINIVDCYQFIINHYEPGDRIFLFGFSRGAYTVRSVANVLMLCGVPTTMDGKPLPKFRKATRDIAQEAVITVLEHGAGHPREKYEEERIELAKRFCTRYGAMHGSETTEHRSNVAPYFIGVFDTVAALGVKGSLRVVYQLALYSLAALMGTLVAAALGAAISAYVGSWSYFPWLLAAGAVAGALGMRYLQRKGIKKTIHDFPVKGQSRSHFAEWKGEHFDRLLSKHVPYARSANAIDEAREDFARLPWGKSTDDVPDEIDGVERLKQVWFPGNHSDVGGSYPEPESRLSDITLAWMIDEALSLPCPLKVGPVLVNGDKMQNSLVHGEALHLFPAPDGVQHCEVAGMKDTIAGLFPAWLRFATGWLGYKVKTRTVQPKASLHQSVFDRLALPAVKQCAGVGRYRPAQLQAHCRCQGFYETPDGADAVGKT